MKKARLEYDDNIFDTITKINDLLWYYKLELVFIEQDEPDGSETIELKELEIF
jgi:hypothetical protein